MKNKLTDILLLESQETVSSFLHYYHQDERLSWYGLIHSSVGVTGGLRPTTLGARFQISLYGTGFESGVSLRKDHNTGISRLLAYRDC